MRVGLISYAIGLALAVSATPLFARTAVTADLVNLRSGPGVNYSIVTAIPPQTPLDILRCRNAWCQVLWQGQTGYISSSLLATAAPASVTSAPPPVVYVTPRPSYSYEPYGPGYDDIYEGGFYDDGWYAGNWGGYWGPGFWGSGGYAGRGFRGPGLWGRGFHGGGFHGGGFGGGFHGGGFHGHR